MHRCSTGTGEAAADIPGGQVWKEKHMGLDDKIGNKAQEALGKAKEGAGDATDDRELQAEGAADQAGAKAKQAGEHLKDGLPDAADGMRGGSRRSVTPAPTGPALEPAGRCRPLPPPFRRTPWSPPPSTRPPASRSPRAGR